MRGKNSRIEGGPPGIPLDPPCTKTVKCIDFGHYDVIFWWDDDDVWFVPDQHTE